MSWHPLPSALAHGPFTFAEARREGIPPSRLRSPDVGHPFRGVYDPDAVATGLARRCEQALVLLGPDRWFSHLTAARLWGMPVPRWYDDDEPLHVVSWSSAPRLRRPGLVGWRSDAVLPGELQDLLPVVAPAEVWCQLAVTGSLDRDTGARLDVPQLVAVADHVLTGPYSPSGGRRPLADRDDLEAALVRRKGGRGTLALREALDLARAPVHSARETEMRLLLVDHGLPEPEVQVPVLTAAGMRHADLGYPRERLLVEYQGDHHRTDQRQWREDATRRQLFEDAGYRVLWATAADLAEPLAFASRVRRALAGRSFIR